MPKSARRSGSRASGFAHQGDPQSVVVLFLDPGQDVGGGNGLSARPQAVGQDHDPLDEYAPVGGLEIDLHALAAGGVCQ